MTESSFFQRKDYRYKCRGGSLFFTRRLRYVVSLDSRAIDWYVVPNDLPPTEPYSKAPAKMGKRAFSWRVEELFGKVQKLSVTLVEKKGTYPTGIMIPLRSYIVNMLQKKFIEVLHEGSIRYEVRRAPKKNYGIGFRLCLCPMRPLSKSLLMMNPFACSRVPSLNTIGNHSIVYGIMHNT
jgi:hypothetical protein